MEKHEEILDYKKYLIRDIEDYYCPSAARCKDNLPKINNLKFEIFDLFCYKKMGAYMIFRKFNFGSQTLFESFLRFYFGKSNFRMIADRNSKYNQTFTLNGDEQHDSELRKRRSEVALRCIKLGRNFVTKNGDEEHDKIVEKIKSKANKTRIAKGTHNFAYNGNVDHDEKVFLDHSRYAKLANSYNGDPEHDRIIYERHSRIQKELIKQGRHHLAYNGDEVHDDIIREKHRQSFFSQNKKNLNGTGNPVYVIINGEQKKLKSKWEFYVVAYLILILKYKTSDIEYERCIGNRYPDFYIKSLDKFIEVHPCRTMESKVNKYSQLKINIEYWGDEKIKRIRQELDESDNIFPIKQFERKHIKIHDKSFCYDFDKMQIVKLV